jgi:alanine racemase
MPSCWIEVNLDALKHNLHAIRDLLGPTTDIIAVVKANAYGHGTVEVSRTLVAEGVRQLAVTRLEEALPLREAGIFTPVLLLAPALPDEVETVVEQALTACVTSFEDARLLSNAGAKLGLMARAQLKINTGMGRLGVEPNQAVDLTRRIVELPNLELEAAFTHFAQAAGPAREASTVHSQFALFQPLVHHISRAAVIQPNRFHCANSATLLRFPSMRLSCVRPGTLLYGQYPSPLAAEAGAKYHLELRDTFTARARIVSIKSLEVGQTVGYGSEWRATRPSRIATIAVGYFDGLTQEPQTRNDPPHQALRQTMRTAAKQAAQWTGLKSQDAPRTAIVRGERVPIVGRIAMQQCSIDISGLGDVAVGEEVTIFMRRTSAGSHLPRVYVHDA